MREKLEELGLRKIGKFRLHSGGVSDVFWDVEKLFDHPLFKRLEALEPFITRIREYEPDMLWGVGEYKSGGVKLARDLGLALAIPVAFLGSSYRWFGKRLVIVDDVMTTGNSVREALHILEQTLGELSEVKTSSSHKRTSSSNLEGR